MRTHTGLSLVRFSVVGDYNGFFFFFLPGGPRWKIHEACMLALGSVKTIITENVKNGRIQFDMHGFLASVILADLNLTGEVLFKP